MRGIVPPELSALLEATDEVGRQRAWSAFAERFSPILLGTVRRLARDHDGVMDRYGFVLEELRRDDFRRLRLYAADRRSTFANWLVIVTNRLCVDYHRQRYGRTRPTSETADPEASGRARGRRRLRRLLADFDVDELEPATVPSPDADDPHESLWVGELSRILGEVTSDLDPADRLLLNLRYRDDLSVREIAGIMGLPNVFHVYRRLSRLSALLRERLGERGITSPGT